MTMRTIISGLGLVAILGSAISTSARAGDIQGDAYSCDELWVMKNEIYKAGGYCFKTAKAISQFGNAGCRFDAQADVPLSDNQRSTLRDIRLSNERLGC